LSVSAELTTKSEGLSIINIPLWTSWITKPMESLKCPQLNTDSLISYQETKALPNLQLL